MLGESCVRPVPGISAARVLRLSGVSDVVKARNRHVRGIQPFVHGRTGEYMRIIAKEDATHPPTRLIRCLANKSVSVAWLGGNGDQKIVRFH